MVPDRRAVPGRRPAVLAGAKPEEAKAAATSKIAIGTWRYNPRFDDLSELDAGGAPLRRINQGAYFLAEQSIWAPADDSGRDVTLFFRHGNANPEVDRFASSTSLGLRWKGLLPGRAEDVFGLATTRSRNSSKFMSLSPGLSAAASISFF